MGKNPYKLCCVVEMLVIVGCAGCSGFSGSFGPAASGSGAGAPRSLELLAGHLGGTGNVNGVGNTARLFLSSGTAFDGSGSLFVADQLNHTIRKISPSLNVTTFAGVSGLIGSADGLGSSATFNFPTGLAVDSAGNLFVADFWNHTVRKITPLGFVSTFAGTATISGSADGTGAAARFYNPSGLAIDSADNLYVADSSNETIRKITSSGVVTTLAGSPGLTGAIDASGSGARFTIPSSIAVDSAGKVYVGESGNYDVRVITPGGVVTTFAGSAGITGAADGARASARFGQVSGLVLDGLGNLFLSDSSYGTIRKIDSSGIVTTFAGTAGVIGAVDGGGTSARFSSPRWLSIDLSGDLFLSDSSGTIRKITTAASVTTSVGLEPHPGSADGAGSAASFSNPTSLASDSSGFVYVADQGNNVVRKISPMGLTTTWAGSAGVAGAVDGVGSAARFAGPDGIAFDAAGNAYVADSISNIIRKITPAGSVTTLAGDSSGSGYGYVDGTGSAAKFAHPSGLAVDNLANVYVADRDNSAIRKVSQAGVVTTVAGGSGAGSADGAGLAAKFNQPRGLAFDVSGNLFVADFGNKTVRQVSPSGFVTTLAGVASGAGFIDGPAASARFAGPIGVAADLFGNLLVTDGLNNAVRRVSTSATVSTVAGTAGRAGVQLGALPASLNQPVGITIYSSTVYITTENSVLQFEMP